MENKEGVLLQRYELGRLLGQGNFAKVYYARNIKTAQSVAIKVIDKEKVMRVGLMDQIKREISVMKLVSHPNIVQLHEVMATKSKIFVVMEYVKGGELFNLVAKGRLKEEQARRYFQQLVGAIDFCHSREQDGLLHTTCGTPAYVAPEVLNRKGYDGAKADIWSCGVILFVMLAGYLPFHEGNLMEMYRKIAKAAFRCPAWFSSEARKLLAKILDPNPVTRISTEGIMESSWFRKGRRSPPGPEIFMQIWEEPMKPSQMNAFDIISMSTGFDLSGLFEEPDRRKESRFTSMQPAPVIIKRLEEVARKLGLKPKKKQGGVMKLERNKEGRKGVLAVDAEIFEVTPSFHLVEFKKSAGDTLEFQRMWKQDMRPALKDIVWAWQGEEEVAAPPLQQE
ncbi:unnamed protein product [Spirodela intermedia]|uniref:non-specific serine/threonine protein kinase n=1 Tax=Spirodela intermedia TaxID=51605 RepID=A0A7I8JGI7_SPIIN|nr:unnamed protein product [Spirodela intermedia]CAA6669269.1 unnamed protein product [Spirodela intermedia]